MSAFHSEVEMSSKPDKKLQIIVNYNSNKGFVDTLDRLVRPTHPNAQKCVCSLDLDKFQSE